MDSPTHLATVFQAWLSQVCGNYSKAELIESGFSDAVVYKVQSTRGFWALKGWPGNVEPATLLWRFAAMQSIIRNGFADFPLPQTTAQGRSFSTAFERLWELTTWVRGEPLHASANSLQISQALEALGRLHAASNRCREYQAHEVSPGLARRRQIVLLTQMPPRPISRTVPQVIQDSFALAREVAATRAANVQTAIDFLAVRRHNLALALTDAWRGNFLFEGNQFRAIVDWGSLAIEYPALDVARLLGSLALDHDAMWQSGFEAYHAQSPWRFDKAELRALDLIGLIGAAMQWETWLCGEPRAFTAWDKVLARLREIAARLSTSQIVGAE